MYDDNQADQEQLRERAADASTVSPPDSATTLVLESTVSVAAASLLHEQMKWFLKGKSSVNIDASRVKMVDACGLQLLLGFVCLANEQGISVCWQQPSPSFLQAAELLGMKSHLGL